MDETRPRTIEQLEEFLRAMPLVAFKAHGLGGKPDNPRYEHISGVIARFVYPQRNKRERGVVLAYLRHTGGYGRAQLSRLVARWADNRVAQHPLVKRYRAAVIAHLLQHAHTVFGGAHYERMAQLPVPRAHQVDAHTYLVDALQRLVAH